MSILSKTCTLLSLHGTLLSMIINSLTTGRRRARLTRQGQITLPKAIRDAMGAKPGDEIEFVPRGGEVVVELRPRRSVLDFAGIAVEATHRVPGSVAELDEVIARGMTEEAVARETRTRRGSVRSG